MPLMKTRRPSPVLDFFSSILGWDKTNHLDSGDAMRALANTRATIETSHLFITACNKIAAVFLKIMEDNVDINFDNFFKFISEIATNAKAQPPSSRIVDVDENNNLKLIDTFAEFIPSELHQPTLHLIRLLLENAYAAVFDEDGEIHGDLLTFLERPPFEKDSLEKAIKQKGLPAIRLNLYKGGCLHLTSEFIHKMGQSENEEQDESKKTKLSAIIQFIDAINEDTRAAIMPLYFQHMETKLEKERNKPATTKMISPLKKECDSLKKIFEKKIVFELNQVLLDMKRTLSTLKLKSEEGQLSENEKTTNSELESKIKEMEGKLGSRNFQDIINHFEEHDFSWPEYRNNLALKYARTNYRVLESHSTALENPSCTVGNAAASAKGLKSIKTMLLLQQECDDYRQYLEKIIIKESAKALEKLNKRHAFIEKQKKSLNTIVRGNDRLSPLIAGLEENRSNSTALIKFLEKNKITFDKYIKDTNHLDVALERLEILNTLTDHISLSEGKMDPIYHATKDDLLASQFTEIRRFGFDFKTKLSEFQSEKDSETERFIRNVKLGLAIFTLGFGIIPLGIYSAATKGTLKFWQSQSEVSAEKITKHIENHRPNKPGR